MHTLVSFTAMPQTVAPTIDICSACLCSTRVPLGGTCHLYVCITIHKNCYPQEAMQNVSITHSALQLGRQPFVKACKNCDLIVNIKKLRSNAKKQKISSYTIRCSLHTVSSNRLKIGYFFMRFCFLLSTGLTRAGNSVGEHAVVCKLQQRIVIIHFRPYQGFRVSEKTFASAHRLGHSHVCLTIGAFCHLSEKTQFP